MRRFALVTFALLACLAPSSADAQRVIAETFKRHVVIGEGTHTVALEKSRMRLIIQVQKFLDE